MTGTQDIFGAKAYKQNSIINSGSTVVAQKEMKL